jgi:predicted secreted protein
MAEILGHYVKLRVNGSVIVCFKSLTFTHNGEPIDISDSCSNGVRELAAESALRSVDIAAEGIMKQKIIKQKLFANDMVFEDAELVYPHSDGSGADGDIIAGDFVISAYSEGIPFDNVVTFSATLQSTGAFTYTEEV